MTTSEILQQLSEKYNDKSDWTTSVISYPTLKKMKHSFAFRPPNILIDLDNKITEADNTENSTFFKLTSFDQAIEIVDKYFNFKHSSYKDFLTEFVKDNGVDINGDLYLKFYLAPPFE